jgi:hypothetical protein
MKQDVDTVVWSPEALICLHLTEQLRWGIKERHGFAESLCVVDRKRSDSERQGHHDGDRSVEYGSLTRSAFDRIESCICMIALGNTLLMLQGPTYSLATDELEKTLKPHHYHVDHRRSYHFRFFICLCRAHSRRIRVMAET